MSHLDFEDNSPTEQITPPLNVYTITAICSWLPLCTVKRCRLVSKLWNAGAIPILFKRSTLRLKCNDINEISRNVTLLTEISSLGIPDNVQITILTRTHLAYSPITRDIWNDEFVRFYAKIPGITHLSFKNLTLCWNINSHMEADLIQKLIQNSSRTLTQLNICPSYDYTYTVDDLPLPEFDLTLYKFDAVKSLDLSGIYIDGFIVENNLAKVLTFVTQLMTVFDKLEDHTVHESLIKLLVEIVDVIPRTMVNLTISGGIFHDELQDLTQLSNPIRNLSFKEVVVHKDANPDIIPQLYNLLSKHAQTLEHLTLRFPTWANYNDGLKLPALLNLRRFYLTIPPLKYNPNFYISFPPETPNLCTVFPLLRKFCLIFDVGWESDWASCFESLFTNGVPVCPSVRHFEIRDACWKRPCVIVNNGYELDVKYARILKIFPNANNKFVTDLREYLEKKGTYL